MRIELGGESLRNLCPYRLHLARMMRSGKGRSMSEWCLRGHWQGWGPLLRVKALRSWSGSSGKVGLHVCARSRQSSIVLDGSGGISLAGLLGNRLLDQRNLFRYLFGNSEFS